MAIISNQKLNLPKKPKAASKDRKLQTLTIAELDAIAGAQDGLALGNHNETIQKPKPSSEDKPKELQTLTITELDAISGAGIGTSPGRR